MRARARRGHARGRLRRRSAPVAARAASSCRSSRWSDWLADVGPVEALPAGLPMTIEENGFHFRRVGTELIRLAMAEPTLRWDGPAEVRDDLVEDWRERLAHRYPRAGGRRSAAPGRASTT